MSIVVYVEDTFIFTKYRADNDSDFRPQHVPMPIHVSELGFHFPHSDTFQPTLHIMEEAYPDDPFIVRSGTNETILRPNGKVTRMRFNSNGTNRRDFLPTGKGVYWISIYDPNCSVSAIINLGFQLHKTAKDIKKYLEAELLMPEASWEMYTRTELLALIKETHEGNRI